MSMYTIEEVRELLGSRIPKIGNSVPAAWWITTDPAQIDGYDRWVADYDAHRDKIEALAATIGLTAADAYYSSFHTRSTLSGFSVKPAWRLYSSDRGHEPVPTGWRIDTKRGYLVPSRKTKADREGPIVAEFNAVKDIPCLPSYLTGMPPEIYLDDRDFGGTSYRVQYRRGDRCLSAFSGGDPDRQPDKRMNDDIDTKVWYRQRLSVLVALSEEQHAEAAS